MKTTVPKLVCNISGNHRVTTRDYLDKRLADLAKGLAKPVTEADFLTNYVCKDAMKLLCAGKSIDDIRAQLKSDKKHPITADDIKTFLAYNGKQKGGPAGPTISPREAAFQAEQAKAAALKTPAATITKPAATPTPTAAAPTPAAAKK